MIQGKVRTYWLMVPPACANVQTCPITLVFHGGSGDGYGLDQRLQISRVALQKEHILVLPDGLNKNWNDGREEINPGIDDVGFVDLILSDLKTYRNSQTPIFALGVSNGAMFTFRLMCERSQIFHAYATVIGNLGESLIKSCHPQKALPGFMIFADKDPIVPHSGGPVTGPLGRKNRGRVVSAETTANFWLHNAKCGKFEMRETLDQNSEDGTRITKEAGSGCAPHLSIRKWTVLGGGHGVPGSQSGGMPERLVGKVSAEFSTVNEFFSFFETVRTTLD